METSSFPQSHRPSLRLNHCGSSDEHLGRLMRNTSTAACRTSLLKNDLHDDCHVYDVDATRAADLREDAINPSEHSAYPRHGVPIKGSYGTRAA